MEFYLLEFRLNGIKNIEKEIVISFYKQDIRKFNRENYNVKGIFGRNGIGKTAVIKGIEILRNIVLDSDYLILKSGLLNEIINKKLKECYLSAEFLVVDKNNKKHIFEHSINLKIENGKIIITKEIINKKKLDRKEILKTLIIENGKINKNKSNYFKNLDEIEKLSMNLLDRKSIVNLIMNNIYENYGEMKIEDIGKENLDFIHMHILYHTINIFTHVEDEYYKIFSPKITDEKWFNEVFFDLMNREGRNKKFIFKDRIEDLEKNLNKKEKFLKLFNPELNKIEFEKKDFDENYYEIEYVFNYKDYKINFEYESMGMKSLFRLFDVLDTINNGGIVFVDEIDMSIHDLYLNRLIEFFAENGKGQFTFTAHNTSILDTLKKYKNSIDFMTEYQEIKPWIKNGNYSPRKQYLEGMLPNMPYNIEYYDFFEIFTTSEEEG
ncbi:AAA family ATPase [Leptotrichia massiliensis]|uniref:AAA family ATPase n=1 Tax=Leptotrichia massiliensis TaxID=1852388 RepID=UPI0028F0123F|nr:AAA family ATPase [Leptotrichia massiliensis]